jgi:paraquat-inducible protein A
MPHKARNLTAIALILASFALLVPGLARPALTIDVSPTLPLFGKQELYHQTRSIIGTVRNLYDTGNLVVAGLILLFSVIVPFAKGLSLLAVLAFPGARWRHGAYRFVGAIGKWSMADVFTMGILLAYLAVGATSGVTAELHAGFWCFLGYCLLSVASAQLMRIPEAA